MIWRTCNARWLDRYGTWHAWFAWRPVTLENPAADERPIRQRRAWLCEVARIAVIVRGRRFWLYASPADVGLGVETTLPPAELRRRARRGEHLRMVR